MGTEGPNPGIPFTWISQPRPKVGFYLNAQPDRLEGFGSHTVRHENKALPSNPGRFPGGCSSDGQSLYRQAR